jgi:hypothetical protein
MLDGIPIMTILFITALVLLPILIARVMSSGASGSTSSQSPRDEIRRIADMGDATIDIVRTTSSDFREHIDRHTRR